MSQRASGQFEQGRGADAHMTEVFMDDHVFKIERAAYIGDGKSVGHQPDDFALGLAGALKFDKACPSPTIVDFPFQSFGAVILKAGIMRFRLLLHELAQSFAMLSVYRSKVDKLDNILLKGRSLRSFCSGH
ncbi:MAG: hypothetical protein WDO70_02615 [Alphaproteobacteria bacterium]